MSPNVRKPVGIMVIVFGIAAYALAVASLSGWIGQLHVLLELPIYLVLGIAWVPLLMPVARWMETGRFTRPRATAKPGA
ncbi:MAG: DUF2842 domain-containing protein [Sphingomonadaceae bacterium]|nr:DUF2842 domain-containing protein [Sphingomonadaceae bacterium]